MPEIAISGTEFRGEPLDHLLGVADQIGVRAVELWIPENVSPAVVADGFARSRLDSWGGRVVAVSCGVEVAEAVKTDSAIDRLVGVVEAAASLESPRVNTYFGAPGYRDDDRSGVVFLRNIAPALHRAEQLGVTIVLENEFNAFGRDHVAGDLTRRPEALRELMRQCCSANLKLNFDAANFYCAGVEPFPYAYSVLAEYIQYVHVKDVRLVDPARTDIPENRWCRFRDLGAVYATTELGTGAINWVGLLQQLVYDKYDGPITLEPHGKRQFRDYSFAQATMWLRRTLGWQALQEGKTDVQQ